MRRFVMTTCLAVGITLAAAAPARADAECVWTDLPVPVGSRFVEVEGSDGNGAYIGREDGENAILWQGGTITDLGAGINPRDVRDGVVVGDRTAGFLTRVPVRWVDGSWEALPLPAGASGTATDIAANGDILGAVDYGKLIRWPAVAPGTYELLTGPFAGYAEPKGIAADGTITAWARVDSTRPTAGLVRHPDGTWISVENPSTEDATTAAINGDIVVGNVYPNNLVEWSATDGHVVRTVADASAVDVNSAGQVLGRRNGGRSAVWQNGEIIANLPDVAGQVVTPVAIDEDGSVVGQFYSSVFGELPRALVARCA